MKLAVLEKKILEKDVNAFQLLVSPFITTHFLDLIQSMVLCVLFCWNRLKCLSFSFKGFNCIYGTNASDTIYTVKNNVYQFKKKN